MSSPTQRHPEGRERARAFISGRVALKDLVRAIKTFAKATQGLSPLLQR
jgi:hypothetical protein